MAKTSSSGPLKLIQIAVSPWNGTYSVLGLTDKGNVYRLQKSGWVALPMHVAKQNPSEGLPYTQSEALDETPQQEPF